MAGKYGKPTCPWRIGRFMRRVESHTTVPLVNPCGLQKTYNQGLRWRVQDTLRVVVLECSNESFVRAGDLSQILPFQSFRIFLTYGVHTITTTSRRLVASLMFSLP